MVVIGRVSFASSAYVARYILKKQNGQEAQYFYDAAGHVKEFIRCSRMPGIGRAYYDRNRDKIYKNDLVYVPNSNGTVALTPPQYYDRLYLEHDERHLARLKVRRRELAQINQDNILALQDLDKFDYALASAFLKKEKIKKLVRNKV